jgi:hypothetical protein
MKIGFVLEAKQMTKAEFTAAVGAIKTQLVRDVAPAWGLVAPQVEGFDALAACPPDWSPIAVIDHADQAGALGYHTETPDGRRYGRVFVVDSRDDGDEPSSVMSHEGAELLVDPACNVSATDARGRAWALEVADPCESDGYEIGGIVVSNFVLPAFFDASAFAGSKFDQLGKIGHAFQLAPGGYAVITSMGRTRQIQADGTELAFHELAARKQHPASRTAQRFARPFG